MSIRRRIKVEARDRKDVLADAVITQDEFFEKFFAKPDVFHFLFGAGFSATAGIPLAQDVIDEIIIKVFEKTNPAKRGQVDAEDLKEWISREKWYSPSFAYISSLEKEYPSAYLRTELFKRYMRGRFPSPAQLMHAIGVKEGKLANRCYTTNWDTLTEDAFYWLRGTNCITIRGLDQLREVKDFEHRYVIKIHGDYDRYDVRYLREGMAKHNDDLRDFLVDSLAGKALVVIGYSGAEYTVMNMLMEIVHDHPDVLSGGLMWGYQGNLKHVPEPITDLMAIGLDKGKDFRIFETEDADFIFERISAELKFTSVEDELAVAFFRFNKMPYGDLRGRLQMIVPKLADLVHRDLLDEGFLVRDYNTIHEVWRQDSKGMFKKKEEKDRAANEAERKFINHCFNDLAHENYADAEVKLRDVLSHFPANEMAHWGLGWAHYATGRYEEAIPFFDEALKLNESNYATSIAKALCYHNLEKYAEEMTMYDRVLELSDALDDIWYNRGLTAHKLGQGDIESQSYDAAVSANSGNHLALYHQGLCLYEKNKLLSSLRCFSKAQEINPRFFEAIYNSGILLGKLGQDMQAISNFDACIHISEADDESFKSRGVAEVMTRQYDQAVESYEEYLNAIPQDIEAWANHGVALLETGRLDEALEYTEKYLGQNRDDARVWYTKGLILYEEGEKGRAMEAFDKSISLNDDYDMVWYRKALLLGEIEDYVNQIEFLTRFLDRNEQDLRGWFELGEANRKLGLAADDTGAQQRYFSAAVAAYDRALDIQRTDVRTWQMKAVCLNLLHRYEEVLECVKYLERYDKNNPEVYYQKGLALDGQGDKLAAVDTLAQALKIDGDHEGAYFRRGILLAELEQYAKAVDHFDNVLRLNESEWQAYHFKGVCIIKQKEYEKALTVFDEGASRFPARPRFLVDQALAFVMMRRIDEARGKLKEAISLNDDLKGEIMATPEFSGLLG
ncbi:tetratricopeptide repeat protein [bacterium]|nr:tetratricopeptide repeat protein [bacterium]